MYSYRNTSGRQFNTLSDNSIRDTETVGDAAKPAATRMAGVALHAFHRQTREKRINLFLPPSFGDEFSGQRAPDEPPGTSGLNADRPNAFAVPICGPHNPTWPVLFESFHAHSLAAQELLSHFTHWFRCISIPHQNLTAMSTGSILNANCREKNKLCSKHAPTP